MHKQTITFEDWMGNSRTEEFWFHLSKSELVEMELANNGFGEYLQRIISSNNGRAIMDEFKKLILGSYGVRSDDGRRFIKSPQLSEEFSQTPAYDQLFVQLVTDANFASKFVNGLVPPELAAQARSQAESIRRQPQDFRQAAPQVIQEVPTSEPGFQPPQAPQQSFPQPTLPDYTARPPHESGPGYVQNA